MKHQCACLEFLEQELAKLQKKVYCTCGKRLIPDPLTHNLICPTWLKEKPIWDILTNLKTKHKSKYWGTIEDLGKYKAYKKIYCFIKKKRELKKLPKGDIEDRGLKPV